MINVFRVESRTRMGGHDVPKDKIISRYDRALRLVKDVVEVSDICHIYDNSEDRPFRIFKKCKQECYYDECEDWFKEDIEALTNIRNMQLSDLNVG